MSDPTTESVQDFRLRARDWLKANMPSKEEAPEWDAMSISPEQAERARELQAKLFQAEFAGLCFPREYGGQGLDREYQTAFTEESSPYEMPLLFNTPTLTVIAPLILEMGTEEQKQHLSKMISGEELWVQFMSEPSGGSDMAGCQTRATFDGENYLLNGSKIWSSYAYFSDYAVCLVRTDWDAVKHQGLTMFIVKIHQQGITVNQIRQSDGSTEFCQEFFDDVPLPPDDIVGNLNDGWTSAQCLLMHERASTGGSSPYASGTAGTQKASIDDLIQLARGNGKVPDEYSRQLLAETYINQTVQSQLVGRVIAATNEGTLPPTSGALLKLFSGKNSTRRATIAMELAGVHGAVFPAAEQKTPGVNTAAANRFIFRQASCLGGGSSEIQRNIISERILGMPRELAGDRGVPYKDVKKSATREN